MTEKTKFLGFTSKGRWDNKSPFNCTLTQQNICKKITKIG